MHLHLNTPVPLPSFSLSFSLKNFTPHISLFITEINLPLFGQISDKTWYTRCHLPRRSQPKPNSLYHHHSNLYVSLCSSLICLLCLDPFLSLYLFTLFYLFPQLLKWRKMQKKCLVWRSSSVDKKRNITTKPVVSVWSLNFSTYFYNLVR